MEYLEHGDLQYYLLQSPPLPEQEAGDITFQILEGLAFMHENGFAHRDLKPAVRRPCGLAVLQTNASKAKC
jgi:serine/threonine protein kinase